jgi:hypothetical protein
MDIFIPFGQYSPRSASLFSFLHSTVLQAGTVGFLLSPQSAFEEGLFRKLLFSKACLVGSAFISVGSHTAGIEPTM